MLLYNIIDVCNSNAMGELTNFADANRTCVVLRMRIKMVFIAVP